MMNETSRAREYLEQCRIIAREIRRKEAQVATLRELSTDSTAKLSDMPRSDSPNLQKMEGLVCRITDLEAEIKEDMARLEALKIDLTMLICHIPNDVEQQILLERYVSGHAWTKILETTGYSKPHVYRLHDEALAFLDKILAQEKWDFDGTQVGLGWDLNGTIDL